ncbi:hypothetical protein Tco_1342238 [Tanacetum coccineum]
MKEGYGDDEVTLYPTQAFSVNNWALKPNQPKEHPFTAHMLAICIANEPMVFKAPKPSSIAKRVPQGTKLGAQPRHKKQSSLKQTFMSNKEATKGGSSMAPTGSKTSHSKKRQESSSAMDSNPSQPSVSTPVDPGMHKEDQQATGGPTSLEVTSEARANPQLSSGMSAFNLNEPIYTASFIIHSESASGNDALAVSTAEADPRNSAPSTDPHVLTDQTKSVSKGLDIVLTQPLTGKKASLIVRQVEEEEASITIKLEDLVKLVSNVQPCFKDLDSPKDDLVIIIEESDEEDDQIHATKNVETEDSSVPKSSSLKSSLIQELTNQLLVKSLKIEFSNILTAHDLSSSLPTELKDIPSKLNKLTGEIQGLKKQVHDLEIELLEELNEIPTKLEDFTKTVASVQAKLKTLDALPGLLSNVTKALNKFAQGEHIKKDKGKKALSLEKAEKESTESGSDNETIHMPGSTVESSKKKELKRFDFITESGEYVHLTKEKISAQKEIEEETKSKAARHEGEIRKEELIDLLGLDVVNKYYNDKLQYDKYCDKMLNRRAISRITNCDVLTRKGLITLKVYKEDGTSEIILNFKASDLHLGEWREVMEACPKRTRKGWEIIYKQVGTRMDFIHTTKAELGINLDIPLSKQDPLNKLNDFANKKRKHADDIHDYFKANKRLKSSI